MIDALFIVCIGIVVVIVLIMEFPAEINHKPGILDRPKRRR